MEKLKKIVVSKPDLFTFLGLLCLFYLIFFHNIWAYPLMDADETRYVSMSRDMFNNKEFLTLYLNNEYFFEKPPLFFWLECLSFTLFGKVSEFTARFPVAFCGMLGCFLVYFIGKKLLPRSFGVISSIILATSVEYLMLSKIAMLDIVVSICIAFSLGFGLAVYFCHENRKKYYWWLFYIFSGLAVMAKGIPGVIVPFGSMFFIALFSRKLKEVFKPIYIIPGGILFLLIVLPWHLLMLKIHNPLFWNEYVIKHHLSRFLGSEEIDRAQPFYFYVITLLWGFFPWIISALTVWLSNLRKIKSYNIVSNKDRFLLYNLIIVLFTLFFFSLSETKLITYILPVFPFLAFLVGNVWWDYLYNDKNSVRIGVINYIIGTIFVLAALAGVISSLFLPQQFLQDLGSARIICVLILFSTGLGLILFTKVNNKIGAFASLVLFMTLLSAICTEKFFQIDYKFGQYDLMKFAKVAEKHDVSITTFGFGTRYSLLYYGNMPVVFGPQAEIWDLKRALKRKKDFVIIKNKDLKKYKKLKFDIIETGRKYSIIDEKGKSKNVSINK